MRPFRLTHLARALRGLGLSLLLFAPALAQEEAISTDRPDRAETPTTVGAGRVQLETGISLTREDGQDYTSFPTLIRIGTGKRWEFRIESDLLHLQNPEPDSFHDVILGTKVTLYDGDDTHFGLILDAAVPVGIKDVRGSFGPELKALYEHEFRNDFTLELNAGLSLPEDEEQGARLLSYSWAASVSHPLSERFDAYLELFGEGPNKLDEKGQVGVDGGFTYQPNDDLQFDLSYAKGLSSFGLDWSVGLGMSTRF